MHTVLSGTPAEQITKAYRQLAAALRARRLTAAQYEAMLTLLADVHVAVTVLTTSPRLAAYSDDPQSHTSYSAGVAEWIVDRYRHELARLSVADELGTLAPVVVIDNPHDMRHCALAHSCDACGAAHDDLVMTTTDTPVGVACVTVCPSCVDSAAAFQFDGLAAAIRRVSEHRGHLGIDVAATA